MDRRKFDQEVRMFLDIYNQSLVGTWGFAPLSEGEIEHMAASLKHLIVPEMTTVAEIDGKAVGAVFGLLDYNPRIKQIDGRLFPFGFLRLLWNRQGLKRIRLISTNVVPEYQKWGVGLVDRRPAAAGGPGLGNQGSGIQLGRWKATRCPTKRSNGAGQRSPKRTGCTTWNCPRQPPRKLAFARVRSRGVGFLRTLRQKALPCLSRWTIMPWISCPFPTFPWTCPVRGPRS